MKLGPNVVLPITPAKAFIKAAESIPDDIISIINNLIVINLKSDGSSRVFKDTIITEILTKRSVSETEIISNGWLNLEYVYSLHGWYVESKGKGLFGSFVFTPKTKS